MAQGMTKAHAIEVISSSQRNLATQRTQNVLNTRATDDMHVVTDDLGALKFQLDRAPGNKTSALEVTGKVEVGGQRAKSSRAVRVGDVLAITRGDDTYEIEVRGLSDQRGPAPAAQALYVESEASRARREAALAQRRAELALEQAELDAAAAQEALDNMVLVAPFSGTVVEMNVSAGEVANGTAIVLANLDTPVVQFWDDFIALAEAHGLRYVHPGDEPNLIAGAATYAVEMLEDQPPPPAGSAAFWCGRAAAGTSRVPPAAPREANRRRSPRRWRRSRSRPCGRWR